MKIDWMVVLGLVGLSTAVVTAPPMRLVKLWLSSFSHRLNPFPLLAMLMDCLQCTSFWIGLPYGWRHYGFLGGVVFAGLVSLLATAVDLVEDVVEAWIAKLARVEPRAVKRMPVEGDHDVEGDRDGD